MAKILWDVSKTRHFEYGIDHCVLYSQDLDGNYQPGVAWNGVISVKESPTGVDNLVGYMDNEKTYNLMSSEEYSATIEAYSYPKEFEDCLGIKRFNGLLIPNQDRVPFGLTYRSFFGDDHYKLHLVYNLYSSSTERSNKTTNSKVEPIIFSWSISSLALEVPGYIPFSSIEIDSSKTDPEVLQRLESIIYGSTIPIETSPRLPQLQEIIKLTEKVFIVGVSGIGISKIGP